LGLNFVNPDPLWEVPLPTHKLLGDIKKKRNPNNGKHALGSNIIRMLNLTAKSNYIGTVILVSATL